DARPCPRLPIRTVGVARPMDRAAAVPASERAPGGRPAAPSAGARPRLERTPAQGVRFVGGAAREPPGDVGSAPQRAQALPRKIRQLLGSLPVVGKPLARPM